MAYRVEIEGIEVTPSHFGNYVEDMGRFEWTGKIVGLNGQFVTVRPWQETGSEKDRNLDPRDLRWS